MESMGLTVELARVAGRGTPDCRSWLDEFTDESSVNLVNGLLHTTTDLEHLASCKLCNHLDSTIKLDENLQFLRLSADYCGRPSWKVIKYRCQLANESECFYRCVSPQDQWLRTVIQPQQPNPQAIEIRSNVVPRRAYLARLSGINGTGCPGHGLCTGGFFPISVLHEAEPHRQSCKECALGELLSRAVIDDVASPIRFWELGETDVELARGHARLGKGSEGTVYKIFWRKGIFAKKTFILPIRDKGNGRYFLQFNRSLDKEIEIAEEVSHPNVVHYFGCSFRDDHFGKDYYHMSLFMEFLEESLESRLQEPIQEREPFSFRDILDVLSQIAEAMECMHEKKFVHGDLKPDNILLARLPMPHSESGQFYLVKVADFGNAQRVNSSGAVDNFDPNIGSPKHVAPEVLKCRKGGPPPKHAQKIDVYSFGVLAYQVLTRMATVRVYEGVPNSKIREGVTKDQHRLRPDSGLTLCSLDCERRSLLPLIQRCWHPDPESRPSFPQICRELHKRSIQHGQHGEQERNAAFPCIGDVLAKLLKATITMCCNKESTDTSVDSTDSV